MEPDIPIVRKSDSMFAGSICLRISPEPSQSRHDPPIRPDRRCRQSRSDHCPPVRLETRRRKRHCMIKTWLTEDERKSYMDRVSDTRAGDKHCCTADALRYFRNEVMEMCPRAGLHQIDLLNGSKNKVTEHEYWAQKRGQERLDKG